ncbi:MAG: Glu-tRNA(Gln) amidotransferase subunit GatE [Nanoarchaeota archaeon]|nr:Glu-tRNA(Gln) amidotransferase subunit GatE [Nanoarchaeota archaeon]
MSKSKLLFLKDLKKLDYQEIKLVAGLEIHQQLNTGKLFSKAPCKIVPNEELDKSIVRKLRFSKAEDGSVDKAAMHAFKQQNTYKYLYNDEIATLVDLDEEPPQAPNTQALHTAIQVGQMLNLQFLDTLTFMRKLIIDGSITTGFQRTALLGVGGEIETEHGIIPIYAMNLEEDSSRIISKSGKEHIYSLDRQGIPLIEITTGPTMHTPIAVQEVAYEIGNVLRSFSTTRRGLGTIRQDLNVSIGVGKRVEIKGAQNLELIPQVVIAEAKRQLIMNSIKEECEDRNITPQTLSDYELRDITSLFSNTQAKVIKEALEEKDSSVLAIKLFNMKGILGHEIQENYRFATEISNRNKKTFPSIKGLFHSDELPKYNITQEEVDSIYSTLTLDSSKDGFILIAHNTKTATESLQNIFEIIKDLIQGVQEEVRQVDPKGTITQFLRPMPGASRMYPETDIRTIPLNSLPLEELEHSLPEKYNDKIKRLEKEFELSKDEILSLLEKYEEQNISQLITQTHLRAKELYNFIITIPKDIKKRDNIEPVDFSYSLLQDLLKEISIKKLNTQTIRDIFISLYQKQLQEVDNLEHYLKEHNLITEQLSEEELRIEIKKIISNNLKAPFGALMGMCMKEFSKKADGKLISQILKEEMN